MSPVSSFLYHKEMSKLIFSTVTELLTPFLKTIKGEYPHTLSTIPHVFFLKFQFLIIYIEERRWGEEVGEREDDNIMHSENTGSFRADRH